MARVSKYISRNPAKKKRQLENLFASRLRRSRLAKSTPPPLELEKYIYDPARFLREQYYLEDGRPIKLFGWQMKHILRPIFYGKNKPSLCVLGFPKKSCKSTIGAGLAIWDIFCHKNAECYLVASDKEQSQLVTFKKVVRAIEYNKNLLERCDITADTVTVPEMDSICKVLPLSLTASGLSPSMVIAEEIWQFDRELMYQFWEEMTNIPTRHMTTLVLSYAGFSKDTLLGDLYARGMRIQEGEEPKDPSFYFFWTHENLAPWQTKEYLDSQRKRLRPATYLRLHENRWVEAEDSFITEDMLKDCIDPMLARQPIGDRYIYVGIDASMGRSDYAAVVAVSREGDCIELIDHKIFVPDSDRTFDLEDTIEATVLDLNSRYTIMKAGFDPYQMLRSAATLKKKGVPMMEFQQTSAMLDKLATNLYMLIRNRKIKLYNDVDLITGIRNAAMKESSRGFKITKKKKSKKVDVVIALGIASQIALESAWREDAGGEPVVLAWGDGSAEESGYQY